MALPTDTPTANSSPYHHHDDGVLVNHDQLGMSNLRRREGTRTAENDDDPEEQQTKPWRRRQVGATKQQRRRAAQEKEESFLSKHAFQFVYLIVCYGCWGLIFAFVYPLARQSQNVEPYHCTIGYIVFATCVVSYWMASTTSPGHITQTSDFCRYDNYKYDGILYGPSQTCPTLHIRKLARSKYDVTSQSHVPRFDHNCPVLVQTIGEENYRLFLAFLLSHTAMCAYGSWICVRLLWGMILLDPANVRLVRLELSVVTVMKRGVTMVFFDHFLGCVAALFFLFAAGLAGFLFFHLYLTLSNMTTNEFHKWKELREDYDRFCRYTLKAPCPFPKNFYNLGLIGNVSEVLFPRSLRRRKRGSE